jgi:hypothetical protein
MVTGLIKRSIIDAVGGADEFFYTKERPAYLLALCAKVGAIDEPVMYFRRHGANMSGGRPLWRRREKVLTFEKLLSIAGNEGTEKFIPAMKTQLFREYLKYARDGMKKGGDKNALKEAVKKALRLRPWSLKALYYMLKLRSYAWR